MLNYKHIQIKSNKNRNNFEEITLNKSYDNKENRTQKKAKPLLIPEKKYKYNSQIKRAINKNDNNTKQIRLNLSADKRKINNNFKRNTINNTSKIIKSKELKIKKFIYNKKTEKIKENYKKKNNIGENLSKIGLNISSIKNKKTIDNKKENSIIKLSKKSPIKNKLKYAKSIDKQKTLNIIVQKRLFSKKESKKEKNMKSFIKINRKCK